MMERRKEQRLMCQQGVKQIKKSDISARYVFISPPKPHLEVLEKRLRGRGTEKEESVQKRLEQAKNELAYAETPGVHDLIIENDDLETAYKELEDYIFKENTQAQSATDGSKAGVSVQD
jgi:guanylate kinase